MIQNYAAFTIYSVNENAIIGSGFVIQDFHIAASDATMYILIYIIFHLCKSSSASRIGSGRNSATTLAASF